MKVGIIGAGAWGTALGMTAKWAGCGVTFWDREPHLIDQINNTHTTDTPLEGLKLDPSIKATHDIKEVCDSDIILLVTAAQSIRDVVLSISSHVREDTYIILCSKGIEEDTGELLTNIIKGTLPENPIGVLSGPAFAIEVAQELPTAVSIATEDIQTSRWLASALNSKRFRLYPTNDITGVQLGGALKNVLAIASGIASGMKLGQNAQASLVTRGLSELSVLGTALGAKSETFMGLSGLGDIILTCTSLTSRNMKFGIMIGEGLSLKEVKEKLGKLAEGVYTTKALRVLAEKYHVDLPICNTVYRILYEDFGAQEAMEELLSRPLRDEAAEKI